MKADLNGLATATEGREQPLAATGAVREPLHDSAYGHVQGSARYIDDLPRLEGELRIALIGSPCARGRLSSLDLEAVRSAEGVVGVYTHEDIPGENAYGAIFRDEPLLASDELLYLGQPIAVVAAETLAQARAAAALARVEVEREEPVLTIEAASAAGEFLGVERFIERGDFAAAWKSSKHRLEGRFESKGQEQFYLESQAALVIPQEGGSLLVHSSTQNPTEIQRVVAEMLGWRHNQVVCEVLRMGGAFGGKETQAALPAACAALVSHFTRRPVRVIYTKDDDMLLTGKRHEFHTQYRIGFDDDGLLQAASFIVRSNGGAYADLSTAVLERCMLHLDNAYYLPHVSISARVCRTNLPPNTAFRGFGGPQGMAVIENAMEEMASRLELDPADVRRRNLYSANEDGERSVTPYGQRVRGNLLPELWQRLEESSDYRIRRRQAKAHNQNEQRWIVGLSMVPVKFGISFTNKTLNQGNALVNVYTDGSVQVSSGATEMGQGVNTKLAMIAAQELGLSPDRVVVMKTSTEKNNNTSPTAASASTDLNGAATVVACREIRSRLNDFAAGLFEDATAGLVRSPKDVRYGEGEVWDLRSPSDKRIDFADLCHQAHVARVDLGARGFYATPGVDFNRETGQGNPFAYYTTGCCLAEVAIDRWIGTLEIRRLDVLMDIGKPINLGIELGQVIGGLVQGIGWVTAEELVYDAEGRLLTVSPTTYKIPAVTDIPADFRVDFFDNDLNAANLRSTKAVGEPPLMLALAVWTAVKDALAQAGAGLEGSPAKLRIPATHEEIARVLADQSVSQWWGA